VANDTIVSFLPAATEIVYALGLADRLAAVTHECDYPPAARAKPVVVDSAIHTTVMSPAEIDRAVSARLASGASLYEIDETLLRALAPALILTQDLCQVCAPSGNDAACVIGALESAPQVLSLTPRTIDGIMDSIVAIGDAAGCAERASALVRECRARLARVAERSARRATRVRVSFLEWTDPLFCAGHWIPEMIEIAGGADAMARAGGESVRMSWSDVLSWSPEVLVIGPCGYDAAQAAEQARGLSSLPGWHELPAVLAQRVFAVDANAFFARPGPRVVEGVELLERLFWEGPSEGCVHVRF